MLPIDHFIVVWERCEYLRAIFNYLQANVTVVLNPDELLRSEWVSRVSALDLYIHEKVTQGMVNIFDGNQVPTDAYLRYQISNETLKRIRESSSQHEAVAAFDLELRQRLSIVTYQSPDKIADGIRMISDVQLWNEVVLANGATDATKTTEAKTLRKELSLIVERRNKIAHEGDLQPGPLREPWSIIREDVDRMSATIEKIVRTIDSIL